MDARERRSQERLHAAVLRLAAERPVAELSVTEVAADAGLHRSTFYEHASSPAGLLEAALLAELDQLRVGLLTGDPSDLSRAVHEVTREVLRHVERHAAIYRRGLGAGSATGSLHAMLGEHFRGTSRRLLEGWMRVEVTVPGVPDDAVADLAVRFIADGTVGIIEGWLAGELGIDDLMATYAALLPTWWPGHMLEPSDG